MISQERLQKFVIPDLAFGEKRHHQKMLPTTLTVSPSPPSPFSSTASSKYIIPSSLNKKTNNDKPMNVFFNWTPIVLVVSILAYFYYIQYYLSQSYMEKTDNSPWPLRIKKGWFFERKMDLTDSQWNSFRKFFPLLIILAILYCVVSRVIARFTKTLVETNSISRVRIVFYLFTSFVFVTYMYEMNAIFPILVASVNYLIGSRLKHSKWQPLLTWIFNIAVLVTSDYYSGYGMFAIRFFSFFGTKTRFLYLRNAGKVDWSTYFNITLCRLISYNIDLRNTYLKMQNQESADTFSSSSSNKDVSTMAEYRRRQEESRSLSDYNFINYLLYVFYVPCYIAGPICSFDAFMSYLYTPQKEVPKKTLIRLSIAVILYAVLMELSLHFAYFVGFNDKNCWRTDDATNCAKVLRMSTLQIASTGILTLCYMYMKFTIIWRFFRVWALWDGQNVPENMTSCIWMNFLVSDFWRSWHRSMYLWIVKYLYVPLGGGKTKLWNVWIIFGFVAIWHDLWWRWVAWAYFNAFLIAFESVFTYIILPPISKKLALNPYQQRIAVAILAGTNGLFMCSANLAIMYGFEGTYHFLGSLLFWSKGHLYLIVAFAFLSPLSILAIRDMRAASNSEKEKP
jgi:D-alanyl-lipoteichoic acid acyltransferase DltB (MBOAT superfamily)